MKIMLSHIFKSLLSGFISFFILITVTFFLVHIIPGGPFSIAEDKNVPQFVIDNMNKQFGLDKPLYVQYINYINGVLHGDLGTSYQKRDTSVNDIVAEGLPISMKIGTLAVIISLIIGVLLGTLSAVYKNTFIDWFCRAFATIGVSVPTFVIGVFFLYFFAVYLDLFNVVGIKTWKDYILPVTILSLSPIAYIARLMRSSMIESLEQDYIRTARSKGVPETIVIFKHCLRNSIIPVVSYLGPLVASLLTGSFIVEVLFTIPGIGRHFVLSISSRDYTLVLGMTIFFGGMLILCNILVDISYSIIDPRIKFKRQ